MTHSQSISDDEIHDYIVAHGFGAPTVEGLALARDLIAAGDDCAEAAAEVVARGLTSECES